ncbi:phenazine biosynthesis-like domain-containing protein 1 [Neolamprologus brichardi]|uniref:phenazine biosynthesis-like domain-containing protein 1 n=1 Tax=Neolamprologus brichardi TaxID=32507 RepID=UPI001643F652|nr:phenazine biosynthesis-like domain-containing protein 1 [Neolamprologus brichardi]
MEIPVFTLDAFTNLPFKGNPAAVCPLQRELSDDLYHKIAAEMNLSETAFITRTNPSDSFTTGMSVLIQITFALPIQKPLRLYCCNGKLSFKSVQYGVWLTCCLNFKVAPIGAGIGSPDCQPGYDFYSRNFAPWVGIPEDPVTGSAHTVLGSYWSDKLGKKKLLAYQCSSRGGELELEVRDDGRINIAGQTITILQGTIKL